MNVITMSRFTTRRQKPQNCLGRRTSEFLKHISTRNALDVEKVLMSTENEISEEFRSKMTELRTKWMHSLFRKEYGFEPTKKVGLLGNAEKSYEALVRAHLPQRVRSALLNNRIVNLFKKNNAKIN